MTRRPKLRVVPAERPDVPDELGHDGELPGDDAHRARDAEALLRAAAGKSVLDPVDHEVLIALSLGEELANVSTEQAEQARALRHALDAEFGSRAAGGDRAAEQEPGQSVAAAQIQPLLAVARAVRAASGRGDIDELTNERLLRRALGQARPGRTVRAGRWRFALAATAAVAASLALFAGTTQLFDDGDRAPITKGPGPRSQPVRFFEARSAQPLFDPATPFPRRGGESARIDRIAQARAAELRANRFASWGVR